MVVLNNLQESFVIERNINDLSHLVKFTTDIQSESNSKIEMAFIFPLFEDLEEQKRILNLHCSLMSLFKFKTHTVNVDVKVYRDRRFYGFRRLDFEADIVGLRRIK